MIIVLDTGPLGLVTNPKLSEPAVKCSNWLQGQLGAGVRVAIPEIADYELRRELIRANKKKGLIKLDALTEVLEYLPITTLAMRQAAIYWAMARQQGKPTAKDNTIDGDMILAAQVHALGDPTAVIATTNVGHLGRFTSASCWHEIPIQD